MNSPKQSLLLFLKGAAMGAADIVPGVSGGTIAFISGIYEELLDSIRAVNPRALVLLKNEGVKTFWQHINGNFLLTLFSGILISALSLARLVSYMLDQFPILIWSFFFGLIVASIIYISRQLPRLGWPEWLGLMFGTFTAAAIGFSPPLQVSGELWVVFLSGALAICAMILPGISGSFILLLIGMYPTIIQAVTDNNWPLLAVFAMGCACGLLLFARLLSWLLKHFYAPTVSILTGFLLGSLLIIWPWKEALEVMLDSDGHETILSHRLLMPEEFGAVTGTDPQTGLAICMMLFGIVLLLGLEHIGSRQRKGL